VGSNYNGYSANDYGSEYAGYSNTYENSNRNTYSLPTRATPTSFRGYSDYNNKLNLAFNAYSSGIAQQDSDFDQYKSNNKKRRPAYSGYSNSAVLEHYAEDSTDSDSQGYHDSSDSASYSENDQVYSPYSSGESTSEYSFGKQKGGPYNNFNKGHNKYSDVHPTASETRYTRGNAVHVNHNRDVPSYLSDSRANGQQILKAHGMSSAYAASGKPSKYRYNSRYAPNSGLAYLSRERDAYYAPYGKGSGKIIIIKEKRPSHAYTSEPSYADNNAGYRSKNGGFMDAYSTLSNFDGYGGSNGNYNDGMNVPRRYRYAGGPMILQKTVYSWLARFIRKNDFKKNEFKECVTRS